MLLTQKLSLVWFLTKNCNFYFFKTKKYFFQKPDISLTTTSIVTIPSTSRGVCQCENDYDYWDWDSYRRHDCYRCKAYQTDTIYYEDMEHTDVEKYVGYSPSEGRIVYKTARTPKASIDDLIKWVL